MNKYTYRRCVTLSNIYEIEAVSEDAAETILQETLEAEFGSLVDYEIFDSDIALINIQPSYKVRFDGTRLIVSTRNGSATLDLTEIIDGLCAKADGGDQ